MSDIDIVGEQTPASNEVLTAQALEFVAGLHREFDPLRQGLLLRRADVWRQLMAGQKPDYLPHTSFVREGDWQVAATPADLQDRRVEITGPVERKMMINALNSGAQVFMADFEDSLSPTWSNIVEGQKNLIDAVRRRIAFRNPAGKEYRLAERTATLLVRPRGWHLPEKHVLVDGEPISASLFDFGLYLFHNARELLARGSGPYFYLAKLENHLEARLWNEVFNYAQEALGLPRGTIRATVLLETILASLEMEEILYELREHSSGLNAGRWDYIFSAIKKFGPTAPVFPDRAQVTMDVPFMYDYTELLVRTCHRHGAHAIGGMAAFIPSRRNPEVNRVALDQVRRDKERESSQGFDGTWVAHPDLVPVAAEVFDHVLGAQPNQKDKLRQDVRVGAERLLAFQVPGGQVTEAGVRNNVSVALQYLNSWLLGNGAAAIFNLMEDAATAEIARAQLWQWVHQGAPTADGRTIGSEFYATLRDEELQKLGGREEGRYREAAEILDQLVLQEDFTEFLTIPAYNYLD